ncbi:hypothetical protein K470DRAFT_257256 [Piedraia hortae CBS 480.64]|uniref:F-box domain-containing protein n=1 Tax=Piedraia hortae CBS 480.64 TaxID=1314780 RepID=A0A6A7C0S3_9PEZI|nr:hypothetical protein K470DRAFT_257256 [Piedraia hortae CBS 480.64]
MAFPSSRAKFPSELQLKTLINLHDDLSSLVKAAMVSKAWFDLITDIIWKKAPFSAFKKIPDLKKGLYARRVKELVIDASEISAEEGKLHEWETSIELLLFPNLNSITITDYASLSKTFVLQPDNFLPCQLQKVSLTGPDCKSLTIMNDRCRYLNELSLMKVPKDVSSEILASLLRKQKYLKSFEFSEGVEANHIANGEILAHLARRNDLNRLKFHADIDYGIMEDLSKKLNPFPTLMKLSITTDPAAVKLLPKVAPNLRGLKLQLDDEGCTAFQAISTMTNLRYLKISLKGGTILTRYKISLLASLKHLRTLRIGAWNADTDMLHGSLLRVADFTALFENFREMETFSFHAVHDDTTEVLDSLGVCCPRLKCCDITGVFELMACDDVETFSQMTNLKVNALGSFRSHYYGEYIRECQRSNLFRSAYTVRLTERLRRIAPRLNALTLRDESNASERIATFFDECMTGVYRQKPRHEPQW